MKKGNYFLLIVLIIIGIMVTGCGKNDSSNNDAASEIKSEVAMTEEEIKSALDSIYKQIDEANSYSNALAALIYDWWNCNGWEAFFDKDEFDKRNAQYNNGNYSSGSFYGDAKSCFEYRDVIQDNLTEAQKQLKELNVTENIQGYYDAVKELYLNVNAFFDFAAAYPSGYSELTYAQTISEHQTEYNSLISNVEFEAH